MQCISKVSIDVKGMRYHVECRKCNFCLQNRRQDWSMRLMEELKDSQTAHFITLTYEDKYLPFIWEDDMAIGMNLEKRDLWKWHKAMRKAVEREDKSLRPKYYSVGEYGTRYKRPHYHSIYYNAPEEVIRKLENGGIWEKGQVYIGSVTEKSCGYVAKYLIDKDQDDFNEDIRVKPFSVMSKGLGAGYLRRNKNWHREQYDYATEGWRMYMLANGFKKRMPRYYKDKIFQAEREWFEDVMKTAKEMHGMSVKEAMDEEFLKDIERLVALGVEDPTEYKREQERIAYENIRIKSIKQNKHNV